MSENTSPWKTRLRRRNTPLKRVCSDDDEPKSTKAKKAKRAEKPISTKPPNIVLTKPPNIVNKPPAPSTPIKKIRSAYKNSAVFPLFSTKTLSFDEEVKGKKDLFSFYRDSSLNVTDNIPTTPEEEEKVQKIFWSSSVVSKNLGFQMFKSEQPDDIHMMSPTSKYGRNSARKLSTQICDTGTTPVSSRMKSFTLISNKKSTKKHQPFFNGFSTPKKNYNNEIIDSESNSNNNSKFGIVFRHHATAFPSVSELDARLGSKTGVSFNNGKILYNIIRMLKGNFDRSRFDGSHTPTIHGFFVDFNYLFVCKGWFNVGIAVIWHSLNFKKLSEASHFYQMFSQPGQNTLCGNPQSGRKLLFLEPTSSSSQTNNQIAHKFQNLPKYAESVTSISYSHTQPNDNNKSKKFSQIDPLFGVKGYLIFPNLTRISLKGSARFLNYSFLEGLSLNERLQVNLLDLELESLKWLDCSIIPDLLSPQKKGFVRNSEQKFANCLKRLRNLELLELVNLEDYVSDWVLEQIGKHLKNLHSLKLQYITNITPPGIQKFLQTYSTTPTKTLTTLTLENCPSLTNEIYPTILSNPVILQTLHSLSLSNLAATTAANLTAYLTYHTFPLMPVLRTLNLANVSGLDDRCVQAVLSCFGRLRRLGISGAEVTTKGVGGAIFEFGGMLRGLDVSGTMVDFKGVFGGVVEVVDDYRRFEM